MSNIENGDPKAEKGPHGDLGLQMGTHVEAVAPVSKDALERIRFIPCRNNDLECVLSVNVTNASMQVNTIGDHRQCIIVP